MSFIRGRIMARHYATPHYHSVVVYTENGHYYAKDERGNLICADSQTACIQEAVDYVYNNNGGGTIFIRSGEYVLTTPINITYDAPIAIVGESPFKQTMTNTQGITYLKYIGSAGTSSSPISVINADSGKFLSQQYVALKDLTLGLIGKAYPYTRAVNLNHVNKFWIERVMVFADGLYAPSSDSYGFYTNAQGDNGGVMIDTFSANFYAAYKLYLDHFVAIRPQALNSTLGFWLHYAGSEIMLINPHAIGCTTSSFHIVLAAGGSATLIEPYSEGSPTYDYYLDSSNQYVTLINPRAGRTPPVVYLGNVDFSKINIAGGMIKTRNTGVATIAANATSATVSHGLICTPTKVLVTPLGQPSGSIWVSGITSSQFTINISTAPSSNLSVAWRVEC